MAQKEEIKTEKAPKMFGPLSQGIRAGNLIFVNAGPIDVDRNELEGDFVKAARQTLENVKAVLEAAGSSMANVVRVDCFIRDYGNIEEFNKIYAEYMPKPYPVRSISQPARTPRDHMLAMVVTALAGDQQ